ncbi:MAG: hypothetical protein ACPL7O_11090, partial [Armatimonadota bacterium]
LSRDALRDNGLIIARMTNADNPLFGRYFYRDFTHETPFTPSSIRQCLHLVGLNVLKIDYEKKGYYEELPEQKLWQSRISQLLRRLIRSLGLGLLQNFLGIPVTSFAEDLIVVAKK